MLHSIQMNRKGQSYFQRTRALIPVLLKRFEENKIQATWATVGLLMAKDRLELTDYLPHIRPVYADPRLDPYRLIDAGELGRNEQEDPFHFAPSLVRQIRDTPGQEIGTHTFSHFYCEEDRRGAEAFEADLMAAQAIAEKCTGKLLKSLVLPRNQVYEPYQKIWKTAGIKAWRTNPSGWFWEGTHKELMRKSTRLFRLANHYIPGTPASVRMLRPYIPKLDSLVGQQLKIQRIKKEMSYAAEAGKSYHLWWHPHNMATHPARNLEALDKILLHFNRLKDNYGMESKTMAEALIPSPELYA